MVNVFLSELEDTPLLEEVNSCFRVEVLEVALGVDKVVLLTLAYFLQLFKLFLEVRNASCNLVKPPPHFQQVGVLVGAQQFLVHSLILQSLQFLFEHQIEAIK